MNKEYDYLFKLVIIGNSGVGKSSVLIRFADDSFNETYLATIGVDFRFKTVTVDNKRIKLQIWDTAGQERFRTITNAYYKGADGIIMVYDTTNESTFADVEEYWFNEIDQYAEKNVELLLLGNKSDMKDVKQVTSDEGKNFADKKKMAFFETSAKTAEQIEIAFTTIAKTLMVKKQEQIALKKQRIKKKRDDLDGFDMNSSRGQVSLQPTYPKEKPTKEGTCGC